jgi:dihydroorotase
MSSIMITNARIINTDGELDRLGDILILNGLVADMGSNLNSNADTIIDASGLVAAPGLVDMHVHTRDPGFTYKEDILSVGECAAAGGVTTLAAMPNTNPAADNSDTIAYVLKKSQKAQAKILPVAAVTKGLKGNELVDFAKLKACGAVAFSDDGEPVSSAKLMAEAIEKTSWLGSLILAHCEDKSLSGSGLINEGLISEMLGVLGIPCSSESVGIAREVALAKALNARIHICHVSTSDGLEIIRHAKQSGVMVTAETCPHYFSFNEEQLIHQDADYRMNPPLRAEHDKRAVIRAIIDGTIDAIATDHAPHSKEDKKDFLKAPNGVIGLETALAAGITGLVNRGYISLFKLIYMMSTIPAKILGIDAGSLQIGKPADIVLFDPEEKWIVKPDNLHGKSINTPFKGMELCGKVKYTFCRGTLVYKHEELR